MTANQLLSVHLGKSPEYQLDRSFFESSLITSSLTPRLRIWRSCRMIIFDCEETGCAPFTERKMITDGIENQVSDPDQMKPL